MEFLTVERNDLLISGSVPLHSRDAASAVVFSDGEYLGTISPSKDVCKTNHSFVAKNTDFISGWFCNTDVESKRCASISYE